LLWGNGREEETAFRGCPGSGRATCKGRTGSALTDRGKEAPAKKPNTLIMPRRWMRVLYMRMLHWRGIAM